MAWSRFGDTEKVHTYETYDDLWANRWWRNEESEEILLVIEGVREANHLCTNQLCAGLELNFGHTVTRCSSVGACKESKRPRLA